MGARYQPRASRNLAINPEYLRVGEVIAFSSTSTPPAIVTPERERVTAVWSNPLVTARFGFAGSSSTLSNSEP